MCCLRSKMNIENVSRNSFSSCLKSASNIVGNVTILQIWNSIFMFSMHSDPACLHYSINIIRSLVSCSTCPISTRGRTSVVWRPVVSAHYLQSLPLVVKMTCASAYACVCRRQTGLWSSDHPFRQRPWPANWAA